jgi:chemotaxis protein histidine kinase CheA
MVLKGDVSIESKVGEGTKIQLILPLGMGTGGQHAVLD